MANGQQVQQQQAAPQFNTGRQRTGKTNVQRLEIDPTTQGQISAAQATLPGLAQQFGNVGQNLFTNFASLAPQLNTQFSPVQFGQSLDPTSRNLVSQGQQGLLSQANAATRAAQRNVGGGAGNILGQLAQQQARIQQNPLLFQAAQQQRQREAQQFALNQQAQTLANQARLDQARATSGLQQAQNAALTQQGLLPLQAQQSLLGTLGNLAQLQGQQTSFQEETPGPGLFGNLGSILGGAFGFAGGGPLGGLLGASIGKGI